MRQGALLAVAIAALKPKQRAPPVTFQLFGRTIDIHNNRSYARMTATFPERSLLVLTKENPIRKAAVLLTQATLFERLILLVILFNCITLSMFSNREGFDDTALGKALATCELAWLAVFTVEAVAKIIAMGLVLEEGSYMRDGEQHTDSWSCL